MSLGGKSWQDKPATLYATEVVSAIECVKKQPAQHLGLELDHR